MDDQQWERFEQRKRRLETNRERIRRTVVTVGTTRVPAERALKQPETDLRQLADAGAIELELGPSSGELDLISLQTEFRFDGYIRRELADIERQRRHEHRRIPEDLEFEGISGLSREMIERLSIVRPATLGQASRIPGVTPAAIAVLGAHLEKARTPPDV